MPIRLFVLQPTVIFQARVNQATITYPLDEVTFDTVTVGAYTDIHVTQTVLFGTAAGLDDLGRQRIRAAPTSTLLKIGRSSKGVRDGEVNLADNMFITVLDDFRLWSKIPYIEADGTIRKDSELAFTDQTIEPAPVANAGAGKAATIDPITGLITVAFDGSASFAVADGATITGYAWELKDGTATAGSVSTATVTATFPAGFRWIRLTVTDSNGKTMTSHRPIYARDPADDGQPGGAFNNFQITSHRIAPKGQQIGVRILSSLPASTFPDGSLVLIWDGEPASAADRNHMLFIGWHQTDPASIQAERTGLLRDITLQCLDVAGRLDTLPGFPQTVTGIDDDGDPIVTPTSWYEMPALNFDKFMHYLLMWDSTALEVADWVWSGTGDDYEYFRMIADGESLYDRVERQAMKICPDHHFTCNTKGQLFVKPDPMLQDTGDRTATIQATLTAADYSDIKYTAQRPPRIRQLWGEALQADPTEAIPLFCVAPGNSPGQGEQESRHSEQLATGQSSLNAVTGHRYARLNARQGPFSITLAEGSDKGIEPANMTWVRLTITAAVAAQRGLAFTTERGLVQEINIRYSHERTGLVRSVELTWERETTGVAAATFTPAEAEPVDDGDDWTPPPITPAEVTEPIPETGVQIIGCISNKGVIFKTANFQTTPPTWVANVTISTNFSFNDILSFVVDPFSPLYRGLGSTVRGFAATEEGIWRIDDIFGTPAATELYTFADDVSQSLGRWRSIAASFGRFEADEADNPWIMVASSYNSDPLVGVTAIYSRDAGATWSTEVEVTGFENPDASNDPQRIVGIYLSPKTPGYALLSAYTNNSDPASAAGYESTDWGATWSAAGSPSIVTGNGLGGCLHVPWPDNDSEGVCYNGHLVITPTTEILTYGTRRTGTDITPSTGGKTYGPYHGLFGIRTHDTDRRYVAVAGRANGVDALEHSANERAAVFVSSDYGDTWTLISGPHTTAAGDVYPDQVAFAPDTQNTLFLWGMEGYVGYSTNFGAAVADKSIPAGTWGANAEMVGFVGGEAP